MVPAAAKRIWVLRQLLKTKEDILMEGRTLFGFLEAAELTPGPTEG